MKLIMNTIMNGLGRQLVGQSQFFLFLGIGKFDGQFNFFVIIFLIKKKMLFTFEALRVRLFTKFVLLTSETKIIASL